MCTVASGSLGGQGLSIAPCFTGMGSRDGLTAAVGRALASLVSEGVQP